MKNEALLTVDHSAAGRRAWAGLLLRRPELLSRFQLALRRLGSLPRGARRRLQRRAALSLAGAALMLALSGSPLLVPPAHAAGITVGGACTLVDAVRSANNDTAIGACSAGNGADIIHLSGDVTITQPAGYHYQSDTGLYITSDIVIDGHGHTIRRDTAQRDFRLMAVGLGGRLTLDDVTLTHGSSGGSGGAVYVSAGFLDIRNSNLSGNFADEYGGAVAATYNSTLLISASILDDNYARYGGGAVYGSNGGSMVIEDTTIGHNSSSAEGAGGGVAIFTSSATISQSTLHHNNAGEDDGHGGAVFASYSEVSILASALNDNQASHLGGGLASNNSELYLYNVTISGNTAEEGGGLAASEATVLDIRHATITNNVAGQEGGGLYTDQSPLNLHASIVAGNAAPAGAEIDVNLPAAMTIQENVLGHAGLTNAAAFSGFTPGATNVTATSNGNDSTPRNTILAPHPAANGGRTPNFALTELSPAIDLATTGLNFDQRGKARPIGGRYDAGAIELRYGDTDLFFSPALSGTIEDTIGLVPNLAFKPHDILRWDGGEWTKWFNGAAAGLRATGTARHDIAAFWIPGAPPNAVAMSFTQNARRVPGISGKVDGMDLVWWNGNSFSLWFDGQDVGLADLKNEKIDALHVLEPEHAPRVLADAAGGNCSHYLLLSTQGRGQVTGYNGAVIRFDGADVMGFCLTQSGANTQGKWLRVLDGRAQGLPGGALTGLSASAEGQTLYLTTKGAFAADDAAGNHSMVFAYDVASGRFSGPYFRAAEVGLGVKVNGLDVMGALP